MVRLEELALTEVVVMVRLASLRRTAEAAVST
jgi:hypothetical protein